MIFKLKGLISGKNERMLREYKEIKVFCLFSCNVNYKSIHCTILLLHFNDYSHMEQSEHNNGAAKNCKAKKKLLRN